MIHKPNKKISFVYHGDDNALHAHLFRTLVLDEAKTVWGHGTDNAWNGFGVRDPAPLLDERGYWARDEAGRKRIFYTGSRLPDGNMQSTGIIHSADEEVWECAGNQPAIEPDVGAWDSKVASTPWAIQRRDGKIYLYYRGLSEHLKNESIGVAISDDGGQTFNKYSGNPILARKDFAGQPQSGPCCLGVVNVCVTLEGQYLICFEGSYAGDDGRAAIFAAVSNDGLSFTAINDGQPMFSAAQASAWHVNRVANPRITTFAEHGLYMLSYNGHFGSGRYALGVAFSRDLINWQDYGGNPVFYPTLNHPDDPFSGRLEGLCFDKAEIEGGEGPVSAYFMAIPKRGPSHRNSVIARAIFQRNEEKVPAFRYVPAGKTGSLKYDETSLSIENPDTSRYSRVHIETEKISSLSFSFSLTDRTDVYLTLAREPQLADFDGGLLFRLANDGVFLSCGSFRFPDILPLSRTMTAFLHKIFPALNPQWEKICSFSKDEWQEMEIVLKERLHVRIGGIEYKTSVQKPLEDFYDIALHVKGGCLSVKDMVYKS